MDTLLVTGANRGLGLELVKQYAAEGWRVFACARSPSPALAAVVGIHRDVRVCRLDVADHGAVDALAAELAGEPIDVLVNNAGTLGRHGRFDEEAVQQQAFGHSDYEDWERVFRVNVLGPMKMAEAFVGHVVAGRQRKIVTFTSIVGSTALNTSGGLYAYRASKAAVNAIMKSMALDLGRQGILAVAIHPGWSRTAMGGPRADLGVAESIAGVRRVIAALSAGDAGKVLAFDGQVLPY